MIKSVTPSKTKKNRNTEVGEESSKKSKQFNSSKLKGEIEDKNTYTNEGLSNYTIRQKYFQKISVNLTGCTFSFLNIHELFISKNISKKIRNGIFLQAKVFKKFICLYKYFSYLLTKKISLYWFLDQEAKKIDAFYTKFLKEGISKNEVEHIISEFLNLKYFKYAQEAYPDYSSENPLKLKYFSIFTFSSKCKITKLKIDPEYIEMQDHVIKTLEEIIKRNKSITILKLDFSYVSVIDFSPLFNSIAESQYLNKLSLIYYPDEEDYASFCFTTPMSDNYISLFKSLEKNKSIVTLSVFFSDTLNVFEPLITQCFTRNKTIKELNLQLMFLNNRKLNLNFLKENTGIEKLSVEGSYSFIELNNLLSFKTEVKNQIKFLNIKKNSNLQKEVDNLGYAIDVSYSYSETQILENI